MRNFVGTCVLALGLGSAPALSQGPITDEQKESLGFSMQHSEPTLQRIFEEFSLPERKRIQTLLKQSGLYDSGIDGVFGPATMNGIIEKAWRVSYETGERVRMSGGWTTRIFLKELLEMSPQPETRTASSVSPSDAMFFVGEWDCNHMGLNFAETSYRIINTFDGSTAHSGTLVNDGFSGGFYFLKLEGYGNMMVERDGRNILAYDGTDGSDALCSPA